VFTAPSKIIGWLTLLVIVLTPSVKTNVACVLFKNNVFPSSLTLNSTVPGAVGSGCNALKLSVLPVFSLNIVKPPMPTFAPSTFEALRSSSSKF
jgi:hypothetical protein